MGHNACSICLETLIHPSNGVTEPIGAALCGHVFHCECFWRWEEAKRQQDWRNRVASRGCPCPVCNVPVEEFVKLFIDGDTNTVKKLKKELKLVKCKLARESLRLETTRQQLVAVTEAQQRENPCSSRLMESSRLALERDIQELVASASLVLDGPPPRRVERTRSTKRSKSRNLRRHDSCPVSNPTVTTEVCCSQQQDPPSILESVSMPPIPLSQRFLQPGERRPTEPRQRRRSEQPQSPRRRPEDAPPAFGSLYHSRRHLISPTRAGEKPDPPRTPSGNNLVLECRSHGGSSVSSVSVFPNDSFASVVVLEEPPSCRPLNTSTDMDAQSVVCVPEEDDHSFAQPLFNFFGVKMDPPQGGLLGGCVYID